MGGVFYIARRENSALSFCVTFEQFSEAPQCVLSSVYVNQQETTQMRNIPAQSYWKIHGSISEYVFGLKPAIDRCIMLCYPVDKRDATAATVTAQPQEDLNSGDMAASYCEWGAVISLPFCRALLGGIKWLKNNTAVNYKLLNHSSSLQFIPLFRILINAACSMLAT